MKRILSQIRDIEIIENRLNNNYMGVVAHSLTNGEIFQKVTPFIYLDKNVYIFYKDDSESFEKIQFDTNASFTVVKNEKIKKGTSKDFVSVYDVITVCIKGAIKKVDEQKIIDEVRKNYLNKYSNDKTIGEEEIAELNKLVIIDTEEIQSFEEQGG